MSRGTPALVHVSIVGGSGAVGSTGSGATDALGGAAVATPVISFGATGSRVGTSDDGTAGPLMAGVTTPGPTVVVVVVRMETAGGVAIVVVGVGAVVAAGTVVVGAAFSHDAGTVVVVLVAAGNVVDGADGGPAS